MRRVLPIAVTFLTGLVVLLGFFGADDLLGNWSDLLVEGAAFLAALALLMGAAHLALAHGRRALRGEPDTGYSIVLVAAMLVTFGVGVILPGSAALAWIFDHLYTPLQATMTALLAFFVVSAAYRAFRLRHLEAIVLLVTSLFMLLGQLAVSERISPTIPALRDWVLTIPVTAGVRGILLGTALGTLAATLRILTGMDRPQALE
jgi:hypothetical protein